MNPQPTLIEEDCIADSGSPTSRRGSLITEQLCERLDEGLQDPRGTELLLAEAATTLRAQAAEIERLKAEDEPLAEYKAMNWRLAKSQRELLAKATALTARVEALEGLLAELFAVVNGECPRLLDEDSGGNAKLYMAIEAALKPLPNPVEGGN